MIPISQCLLCVRRRDGDKCAAYPDGIPLELRVNLTKHDVEFAGDGGLRFIQAPGKPKPVTGAEARRAS